jgi:glucokinase
VSVVLAVDIGGTKLAAAVVDDRGRIRGRGQVPAPVTTDPDEFFEGLVAGLMAALRGAGVLPDELAGVGVGCGGPMRWPEGLVSPLNIPAWRDFPLAMRLRAELDVPQVLVHNDAVALAVGEHWRGAGAGSDNLLAVTVSTGVGGGLILDGRLYHGKSGHVGHIVAEPGGPPCACGGRGCVEAIASGPSSVRWALESGWEPPAGTAADGLALSQAAAAGDPVARRAVQRSGRTVGLALASCAHALDVETAVVAGGFSRTGALFWDALRETFADHARMAFGAATRVVPSGAPADAGLLGAAAFVLLRERYGWEENRAAR